MSSLIGRREPCPVTTILPTMLAACFRISCLDTFYWTQVQTSRTTTIVSSCLTVLWTCHDLFIFVPRRQRVDVHVQTGVVFPKDCLQVHRLETLAHTVYILTSQGECEGSHEDFERICIAPVRSLPEAVYPFLHIIRDRIRHSARKVDIDIVGRRFRNCLQSIICEHEGGIGCAKATGGLHVERTPLNVVLDETIIEQGRLPRRFH